jgi:transposase InsO family protein
VSRFRFVEDHQADYPVKRLCALVEVSRSGFYAWRDRPSSPRQQADDELMVEIRTVHERSRGTYGAPRIEGQLRRAGRCHGRKRIARLMRADGLVGAHARRRWRRGRPDTAPAPDLLERNFAAAAPNQRWVGDITEFATDDGKLYLSGILDLYDRSLVGWSMRERATADLVIDALVLAISRRSPDGEVVHHSDRGSVYTSLRFANHLEDYGLVASFGRTGDAYDNAAMEAFWATLKRELAWIYQQTRWASRAELRGALFDYIEAFYNRSRHQARLEHRTPAEVYAASHVA